MITGMSYGALSLQRQGRPGARARPQAGTSTTTGDGGMLPAERENSQTLIYEVLPSRYGINVHHLRQADAIELTIGQGAKPGTGGLLLGSKVSAEIAAHARPAARRRSAQPGPAPRLPRPDDMIIKIEELREATDWQVPIFVKLGATPRLRRRQAGGQGRGRRGRGRRHGGRHRRLARPAAGAHRHPDPGRGVRGPRGAGGAGPATARCS